MQVIQRVRIPVLDPFAMGLSAVLSPPVTLITALGVAARGSWNGLGTALAVYGVGAVAMPLVYVVWLYRRGEISDLDLRKREERRKPFRAVLGGMVAGTFGIAVCGAPQTIFVQCTAALVTLCGAMAITKVFAWKISVHQAALGLLFGASLASGGALLASCVGGFTLLVLWSRVYLGCHTLGQTVAGTSLGFFGHAATTWGMALTTAMLA